jgi:hypothetical protein
MTWAFSAPEKAVTHKKLNGHLIVRSVFSLKAVEISARQRVE